MQILLRIVVALCLLCLVHSDYVDEEITFLTKALESQRNSRASLIVEMELMKTQISKLKNENLALNKAMAGIHELTLASTTSTYTSSPFVSRTRFVDSSAVAAKPVFVRDADDETHVPTSVPTSYPTSFPTGEPTGIPTLEPTSEPSSTHVDMVLTVEQSLIGFPNASYWNMNPVFDYSYRLTIADRVGLDISFISNSTAYDIVEEGDGRRLSSASGVDVSCNVSIPNTGSTDTPDAIATTIFDEITAEVDDGNGGTLDFAASFLVETESVITNNERMAGGVSIGAAQNSVGTVTEIDTENIVIVTTVDTLTNAPTFAPSTAPADDDDEATSDPLLGVYIGVPLGLGAAMFGAYTYLKSISNVMPVQKLEEMELITNSVVPAP